MEERNPFNYLSNLKLDPRSIESQLSCGYLYRLILYFLVFCLFELNLRSKKVATTRRSYYASAGGLIAVKIIFSLLKAIRT